MIDDVIVFCSLDSPLIGISIITNTDHFWVYGNFTKNCCENSFMKNPNSPSDIEALIKKMPIELEQLLVRCDGTIPDYRTFLIESKKLLRPIAKYDDKIYHLTGSMPNHLVVALDVFSEKKAIYARQLERLNESSAP